MVKLNVGNVLLKPSQRKQLMTWLKRAQRLGSQLGGFLLTINMQRTGRLTEVRADVHVAAGNFTCRIRRSEWRDALREMASLLAARLHDQRLLQGMA
ncbi:MAG: hypothetical protein ABSH22_01205 [Tepidisphaeraceae bacterium]|jgi:hypothetical protein